MKKYFITGLVILLPLAVTIAIVIFIVDFLTKPFMGLVVKLLTHSYLGNIVTSPHIIRYGSQIIILIGLFLITLALGFIARWFFFTYLIKLSDKLLHKIPIVNKVYKTTQEIIKTLFITDKNSFKQVVLIPFPNKETYSVGLVSRDSPPTCQQAVGAEMVSVFVPTTPNPTSGFLIMFKKADLIYLDMKTEEAIKYIVSCGVIVPEKDKDKGAAEQ
jgi:uncharacterized membrane protein